MTDPDTNDPQLHSAVEIQLAAAALAGHLQRSGIQFLPKPNAENVSTLQGAFAPTESESLPPPDSPDHPPAVDPRRHAPDAAAALPPAAQPHAPSTATTSVDRVQQSYRGSAASTEDRIGQLAVIAKEVASCTRCEILSSCRKQTVFGEGSPNPRVAFFGEGPGADEDRTGRPFVGKSGQLLTKMIEACSFAREDVYILNTVKCRPPGNRNPEPEELDNCREYFERQLAIVRPEYIVCLGTVAAQTLLQSKLPVGRLRGKLYRYFESKVLVTYHPAYLLRNQDAKKATWQDLQLMLCDAGIKVAKKG